VIDLATRERARGRLLEDLAGELAGSVEVGPITLGVYGQGREFAVTESIGVVCPRTEADIALTLRFASENGWPVAVRGAGSSGAANIHGQGLVIDCSRYLRDIETIGPESIRVQSGVVLDAVNAAVAPLGRSFPIDSTRAAFSTVGGLLGIDATGSRACRFGSFRDHLAEARVVLASGDVVTLGPVGMSGVRGDDEGETGSSLATRDLISRIRPVVDRARQDVCGLGALRAVHEGERIQTQRLLSGAEGMLGVVTSVVLQTMPLPAARGVVFALFPTLAHAVSAASAVAEQEPSACDLLDRRILSLSREVDARYFRMIPVIAEAALLIEQTGPDEATVRSRLERVRRCVGDRRHGALTIHETATFDEADFLWSLPRRTLPRLASLTGRDRPVLFAEGCLLPPDRLAEFLHEMQLLLQQQRVTATFYGPLFAGGIDLQPFLAPHAPDRDELLDAISEGFWELLSRYGGTVARHRGLGAFRSAGLSRFAPEMHDCLTAIARVFDPAGTLRDDRSPAGPPVTAESGELTEPPPAPELVQMQLRWSLAEAGAEAQKCHGCGICRTSADESRMCPLFRLDPQEPASPRAKTRLMEQLGSGRLSPRDLVSGESKRIADLCFNCKQCERECPSHVPVSRMMLEAKAAFVAENGLKRADWILSRAHSWGALGTATSMFSNWLIRTPTARWLIEQVLGISRHRKLPAFARRSFLASMPRDLRTRPHLSRRHQTVILYVDHFANYHDPDLARAAVEILARNGFAVHVPPGQQSSGMAMISAGDLDSARDLAADNLRSLGEWAREGYRIVCLEPTSVVCLRSEYPYLINHPDVAAVAAQAVEIGTFLQELHRHGRLDTGFAPVKLEAGYHQPCHLRALEAGQPLLDLLGLVPELKIERLEKGCSGMAGAFGLTRENFSASIRIGWPLISRMRAGDLELGLTECSACKLQMEQGTTTPTVHPLFLLAWAYGLMPETRQRLHETRPALIVS
jgi:FAD/FMN-containing dehydrogenase/Fe-S oxidoreductase